MIPEEIRFLGALSGMKQTELQDGGVHALVQNSSKLQNHHQHRLSAKRQCAVPTCWCTGAHIKSVFL